MTQLQEKYQALKKNIQSLKSVAIAFSGGVDSTFLLKAAHDVLGDQVVALTARSLSFPKRELDEAIAFTTAHGIKHIIVDSEELDIEGFSQNPANRCYLCKTELFTKIKAVAEQLGLEAVAEASNTDDDGDYRPGLQAVAELAVKSPLREAHLSKQEIRDLSKELGLPTWNKPSFACLASRFPYGENITPDRLAMIDAAEQFLIDQGFRQVRVRYHGNLARIEADEDGIKILLQKSVRDIVDAKLREIGFTYVSLDLQGYRTGSMNATLPQ
ncbi:MAG: ATP-dependent sacrificial sulfur transferase LarE [Clostridia bacterium]|jgi:uncharacterized protein|nr:ATP-dependent sacrificial sulfur transferase LarE [Clostridia bacterium]